MAVVKLLIVATVLAMPFAACEWNDDSGTLPASREAQSLGAENLVATAATADEGVTVRAAGARRTSTETLVTVIVDSEVPVAQLGPPHLRVNGERLEGTIVRTGDDGKVLQMAFPDTPARQPVVLVMGPFAQVPSGESGTVTVNLALSMARQGLNGALGQSGVVDRLTDISARSATAPEVLSYEFRRASRVGEDAHAIAFTLVGNYTDLEAVFALTDAGPLPIDLMESSHRRDANGVLTEGTTRVSFRLPAEIPETVVLGTDVKDGNHPGRLEHRAGAGVREANYATKFLNPAACSYAWATWRMRPSSKKLPMIWRPTGRPSLKPQGTLTAW